MRRWDFPSVDPHEVPLHLPKERIKIGKEL